MILTRDDTFRVVFNLRTPANSTQFDVGSGVFVARNGDNLFLVTATHVARTCTAATELILSDHTGNATGLRLLDFNADLAWQHHSVADISVLQVIPDAALAPHLEGRFLSYDHFHLDRTPVSRDFELTSVGFPNGLGARGMFSPLTYRSYASSAFITMNRADTKTPCDFFMLENPSMGGYSGCPVFDLGYMVVGSMTTTKERTVCYGIMHGTVSDTTGGKLAAVTPSHYLRDLLG
jgi:hypothetical protein